ncbi:hypothetical protein V2J09_011050 [Rumex salicifolius]
MNLAQGKIMSPSFDQNGLCLSSLKDPNDEEGSERLTNIFIMMTASVSIGVDFSIANLLEYYAVFLTLEF